MKRRRLIVVLGMHRSGTSAITRGLQVLGVCLGDRMMPSVKGNNDKGFWEDIDVNALNIEIMSAIASDWHHVAPISQIDLEVLRNKGYFLRAVELLRQKVGAVSIFGLKDPRVAKLLPFWKEVFNHCQVDVNYVLVVRNPLSVTKSLMKRDGFHAEKCYLLWWEHVLKSLTDSVGNKRVLVDYDLLMRSPDHELGRIAKQLDLTLDAEELQSYMADFLDQNLRHTAYHVSDMALDSSCPPQVREIYTALLDVAMDCVQIDAPSLKNSIESWAIEFDRSNASLVLADKLEAQRAAAAQLATEREGLIANLQQTVTTRDGQIASLQQTVAERDGQIASLQQTVTERDGQITSLQQTVMERDDQVADLGCTIDEIKQSTSWRITAPLRSAVITSRKLRSLFAVLPQIVHKGGGGWSTARKAVRIFRAEGWVGVKTRVTRFTNRTPAAINTSITSDSRFNCVPYYMDPKLDEAQPKSNPVVSVAVHLHLYYVEMLTEFVRYLNNIPVQFDLYVSVPEFTDAKNIQVELKSELHRAGAVVVECVPNRGRDIAPMIVQFGERLAQYEIVAHVHTKKSPHSSGLADWCQEILNKLFGRPGSSGGRIAHVIELLQTTAKIVYPEATAKYIKDHSRWAGNYELARDVLEKYTPLSIHEFPVVEFPEGSMFWARAECIKNYLCLPLDYSDFPNEPIPADGTLAHALERLILIFASPYKGQCIRIHEGDSITDYRLYEKQQDYSAKITHSDIKVLSYYLPQFHPIPENDLWHGKGFTEWTKVRAATPLFEGHYQQHIPHSDIGYYLLDSPETLRRQVEQMQKSGVHGQVFYHYWFSGKLILEEPVQLLLNTPDIKMPFCFCWANENWTRRWDGNENEILLGQNYSAQDAHDFIHYLIPFFRDSRYIKVDDRPVLFIYRPSSIPDSREYLDIWASECAKAGIKPPYVVAVLTRGATDPNDFGMDAGVERVLHDWTGGGAPDIKGSLREYWPINGSVLSYDDVAAFYMSQREAKNFTYFRSTVPIWDNTARYGSEAYLLHGSTPQRFQQWMESTIAFSQATLPADRRFVLVNAWNEWAEGAHLEPDSRYGYSYLNSVGRALCGIPYTKELNASCAVPAGIRLHLSFPEFIVEQLRADTTLKQRFLSCLTRSTIFSLCSISINTPQLLNNIVVIDHPKPDEVDFVLSFRKVSVFGPDVIEKMLGTAFAQGCSVISNSYEDVPLTEVDVANGSVHASSAYVAPLLLLPVAALDSGLKSLKMRTDARCFVTYPGRRSSGESPSVTTIIRFHKSANLKELSNALHCLSAMQDCVVTPLIAAQDLDSQQIAALQDMLNDYAVLQGVEPLLHLYHSQDGKGDLRSKMLNESIKCVKTRYAAFLDFDDLLMPHAYGWLIERLEKTGKAVSFGRVFSTNYDSASELLMERKRVYEYGHSYEEFIRLNHAPLHSFMMDMGRLDVSRVVYFEDQRYLEDYLLTLQLFTKENCDWEALEKNCYIGDYIHSTNRAHTLAFANEQDRQDLLSSPEYRMCMQWINDIRSALHGRTAS